MIVRRYLRRFGDRTTPFSDLKAGLTLGVESVPDGLAAGVLAGVNPLFGLNAYLMGTLAGALATGSVFMTVQATARCRCSWASSPWRRTAAGARARRRTDRHRHDNGDRRAQASAAQRKPMCDIPVSSAWGERAAGRKRRQ